MTTQANVSHYKLRTLYELEGHTEICLLFHDTISYRIYFKIFFTVGVMYSLRHMESITF
jgi:hypothetical protein